MQYLMTIWVKENHWTGMSDADRQKGTAAYMAFGEAMSKAGVSKGSNRLQFSSTATTVRTVDGKTKVLDGPYADTKEQLAGYFLIDVPDSDAAVSWATRCPGSQHGVVEVRPIWEMTAQGYAKTSG